MAHARPGLVRNAVGSLAILGIIVFIAMGLPLIDRSLPAARPVAREIPFTVGANVTVVPPRGSSVDLTRTRPADDHGSALFLLDGIRFAVVVAPFHGSLDEAARRIRTKISKSGGYQIVGSEQGVTTTTGVSGLRGAYSSAGRLGVYAVFVHDDLTVEVTASGPEDQLRVRSARLETSLRSLVFGGRPS